MEFIFDLLAQFGGGRGEFENELVRFGLGATFFGILLVFAWKRRYIDRERLLSYGFGFGFIREFFMFAVVCGVASGWVSFDRLHSFFPPLEHSLSLASMAVVVGAYLGYISGNRRSGEHYIVLGLVLALGCYSITALPWTNFLKLYPESRFGNFWGDWLYHIAGVGVLTYGLIKLSRIKGWIGRVVSVALFMFLLNEILMLVNLLYGEAYAPYINPVGHNLHLLAIPLLGYVYLRELYDERSNLIEDIQERNRILHIINDLGRKITSSLRIHEVFESFAIDLKDIIDYDRMSIALVEGSNIKIIASVQNGGVEFPEIVVTSEGSALRRAIYSEEPIIRDRIDGIIFAEDEFLVGRGFKSYMFYPLKSKGKVIGCFNLFSRKEDAFSHDKLEIIECLSKYLAVALENLSLYRQIRDAYEGLKDVEETKKNILSNVSHELLTPNSIAKSTLEFLRDGCIDEEYLRYIDMAISALNRQHIIIRDFVEYSNLQKGKLKIVREWFNLREIIESVLKDFRSKIESKKIKVWMKVEDIKIFADMNKIRHILFNLIDNAIKFNKVGGTVVISGKKTGEGVLISISDTGIGIPEKSKSKIFEPLYQVDSSPSRQYPGTGMGLAVAKRLVEVQGGRIWVHSREGEGTTFYFTIPQD